MKKDDAMLYFMCVVFGLFIGGLFGQVSGVSHMKHEAIRECHAEWVADASGKPQFKWKECK